MQWLWQPRLILVQQASAGQATAGDAESPSAVLLSRHFKRQLECNNNESTIVLVIGPAGLLILIIHDSVFSFFAQLTLSVKATYYVYIYFVQYGVYLFCTVYGIYLLYTVYGVYLLCSLCGILLYTVYGVYLLCTVYVVYLFIQAMVYTYFIQSMVYTSLYSIWCTPTLYSLWCRPINGSVWWRLGSQTGLHRQQ